MNPTWVRAVIGHCIMHATPMSTRGGQGFNLSPLLCLCLLEASSVAIPLWV